MRSEADWMRKKEQKNIPLPSAFRHWLTVRHACSMLLDPPLSCHGGRVFERWASTTEPASLSWGSVVGYRGSVLTPMYVGSIWTADSDMHRYAVESIGSCTAHAISRCPRRPDVKCRRHWSITVTARTWPGGMVTPCWNNKDGEMDLHAHLVVVVFCVGDGRSLHPSIRHDLQGRKGKRGNLSEDAGIWKTLARQC